VGWIYSIVKWKTIEDIDL